MLRFLADKLISYNVILTPHDFLVPEVTFQLLGVLLEFQLAMVAQLPKEVQDGLKVV